MIKSLITSSIVLSSILAFSGCAGVDPQPMVGPNGQKAYSMKCSGMGRTMGDCYKAAGELCSNGYNVIGNDSNSIMYNGMFIQKKSLTVECK